METIILASKSQRRKELLRMAGIPYESVTADTDETFFGTFSAEQMVRELAQRKLKDVRQLVKNSGKLILAADTVVCAGGRIFGKPGDPDEAKQMLKELSGRVHTVYTGIALEKDGMLISDAAATDVYMRPITEAEITAYVHTGEPLDKAGAYGIQERGGIFVSKINGDFYNVVGLPLNLVCMHLATDFGISVF